MAKAKPVRTMRDHAVECLQRWVGPMGFGHYTVLVTENSEDRHGENDVWAQIEGNVEEEWMLIYLDEDLEKLNAKQVEHVMLHELFHILVEFAKTSDSAEEMACNRFASMHVGSEFGVRRASAIVLDAKKYFDDDEREALLDLMPHLVSKLPIKQLAAVLALDYAGRSVRDVAREMGVDHRTVCRWRDAAYVTLREMVKDGV